MIVLAALAAVWWSLAILLFVATLVGTLAQPTVQRRRAKRTDKPPVSIILPIKMLDPGFDRALDSAFVQTYPDFDVFVASAEADSDAVARARQILGRPGHARGHWLQAGERGAASPKLDVLAAPLEVARHDVVMTKDSNITLAPDMLDAFVRNLTPRVGLVVAVPVAVRAESVCGQIEAMLINGHARLLLTASCLGIGFGVGKVMMFRRGDFLRAGGFAALAHTIAEDSALCQAMARLGLKTVFAHRTAAQEIGHRTWREIYLRQVRWAVIRRKQEPVSFPLEPLSSPLPAALAGALAAPLLGLPALAAFAGTLALWCVLELGCTALKGWELKPAAPVAFLGREVLALSSWLRAWLRQDVVWADARYDVAAERHDPAD